MEALLLGVEVGTSAIKAVVYDRAGVERCAARRALALLTPEPGRAEQDAGALWRALVALLREVAAASAAHGRIAALALAAQAGSIVPVDDEGAPVAPLVTWLDQRAAPLVAAWRAEGRTADIRTASGWHAHPGLGLAIVAWMTRHAPAVAARSAQWLDVQGFLLRQLVGRAVTDFSQAAELLLLDRRTRRWSSELCALAGIEPGRLGEVVAAGTRAGTLLPTVAAATGLPPETLVVTGGQDQCCAALGMGMVTPGQLMLASGTAWVVTALTASPDLDQIPPRMDLNFHVAPGVYTVSQLLGGFGAVIERWLALLYGEGEAGYAALEAALGAPAPDGLHFLPLGGSAQGGGAPGGFLGLRLESTRAEMVAALGQGIGCEVRRALEVLAAAGVPAAGLWMSGGATQSAAWPALLASLTGIPVYVARGANWPARGAALLAGTGAGLLGDLAGAAARWRVPLAAVAPDAAAVEGYDARYDAYRALCVRLEEEKKS